MTDSYRHEASVPPDQEFCPHLAEVERLKTKVAELEGDLLIIRGRMQATVNHAVYGATEVLVDALAAAVSGLEEMPGTFPGRIKQGRDALVVGYRLLRLLAPGARQECAHGSVGYCKACVNEGRE